MKQYSASSRPLKQTNTSKSGSSIDQEKCVAKQVKKSMLDVGYLRTATSKTLASSIFTSPVNEEQQRLIHEKQPEQIDIDLLHDNPYQPRQTLDETNLQQLADTIASQGFQGVLVARPHPQIDGAYQITAGHRRRAAAKRSGMHTLPVIVHSWSDQEMATLAATENIQREDLSPLEEGKLFQLMIDEMHLTQIEVANAIKKDRGYVRNRLRLASAPPDIQAFITAKPNSMRAVIYLLDIEDPAERAPIIDRLLQRTLTTEDLPGYVDEIKRQKTEQPALPAPIIEPVAQQTPPFAPLIAETHGIQVLAEPDPQPTFQPASPSQPEKVIETRTRPSTQMKARQTRLRAIYRQLLDYRQLLKEQEEQPTQIERTILQQIDELMQQIINDVQ
jgi:ParB family chromosome partitioning protein